MSGVKRGRSGGRPSMKGEGEDTGLRDFLSLGSRSFERDEPLEFNLTLRDGLNMLAGGSHGGFTLKPPPSGMPLALGGGGERAMTGGGFTGFYRAGLPKTSTWSGMGSLFVSEKTQVRGEAGASSSHREASGIRTDVGNLTPEESWRLVLKLGKRWPAGNGTTALQSPQDRSSLLEGHHSRQGGHPEILLRQDSLKVLTSRALEALAQSPDRYGRPAGAMPAPRLTTQQFSKTKTRRDLSADPTLAVSRQPTLSAKPPTSSSRALAGRRTAPLTIFYDGKVNVCDNVPEDKAYLLMLFAERSNINPNAEAPSTSSSPHATPGSGPAPAPAQPQAFQPSPQPGVVTPVPSHLAPKNDSEGSSSHRKTTTESSNPIEATPPSMPVKVPATEGTSRQLMQQCLNGPMSKRLPNARKNSLARFLDSRKRNNPNASSSEDQPSSKKQELGPASDACPSDAADDTSGSGKKPMPLCNQTSTDSEEGITAMFTNDAEMKPDDSFMK